MTLNGLIKLFPSVAYFLESLPELIQFTFALTPDGLKRLDFVIPLRDFIKILFISLLGPRGIFFVRRPQSSPFLFRLQFRELLLFLLALEFRVFLSANTFNCFLLFLGM